MDIEKRLAAEHSLVLTKTIVKYIGNDKKKFKILLDIFLNSEYRITQRAAWPLSFIAIEHPELIHPHIGKLIKKIDQPNNHPAIPRNVLRIFQEIEIPEKYEGALVESCFKHLVSTESPVAVKAFAITVATSICKKYPELKNELRLHLEHLQNFPMTAAIKVRIRNAFKVLNT